MIDILRPLVQICPEAAHSQLCGLFLEPQSVLMLVNTCNCYNLHKSQFNSDAVFRQIMYNFLYTVQLRKLIA